MVERAVESATSTTKTTVSQKTPVVNNNSMKKTENKRMTRSGHTVNKNLRRKTNESPFDSKVSQNNPSVNKYSMKKTENNSENSEKSSIPGTSVADIEARKNVGSLDSGKASEYNSGEQFRTMWTLEDGVLTKGEVSAFYKKISEMQKQKYPNYRRSNEGEYIFEIENKLVYTDGDYNYPQITSVIMFNTDDENLIDYARECFYEGEIVGRGFEVSKEIVEAVLGEESVRRASFENNEFRKKLQYYEGERTNSTEIDNRSGEDVEKEVE